MLAGIAAALLVLLPACDFEEMIDADDPSLWLRFDEPAAPFTDREGGRVAQVAGTQPELIVPGGPSASAGGDEVSVGKPAPGDAHLTVAPGGPGVDSLAADGGVTVELWLTGSEAVGAQGLVRRGDAGSSDWALSQVDGAYRFEVFDTSGDPVWSVTGGTVAPGVAQQVVATFADGGTTGTAQLWVDNAAVGTTGAVAGAVRADAPMPLQVLEGGPGVVDELIAFDDKVLGSDRIGVHWVGGTSVDDCDTPVAVPTLSQAPELLLDTAAGVGGDPVAAGVPTTVAVGGVAGLDPDDVDMVELEVTSSVAGAVTIWPTGWARPAAPTVAVASAGVPSRVVVPVGDASGVQVESSVAADLRIDALAAWTGASLRPAVPSVAFTGQVAAGGAQPVSVAPRAPHGATAVLLGISVDADGVAGEVSVPDPTDPDLGGRVEVAHPAAPATVVVLAGVASGATTVRPSVDADVEVRVLGWAVNPKCFTAEQVAPQLEITTPSDGAQIDADFFTFEMAGSVSDAGSGLAAIDIAVDGTSMPDLDVDLTGEPGTWSVEASVPDGQHVVQVTARDFAGNTTSRQVTVSSTSPGAGVTVPDPGLVVPQADLASAVVSFDAEAHVLVLDDLPGVLSLVEPGSTIAVDPIAPHLPDGLFHEVVRIQPVPGGWSVQLAPASMFEAFRQIDVTQAPAGAGAPPPGDAGAASSDAPSIGRDFDAAWCDNGEYEPDPGPDPDPDPGGGPDICAGMYGFLEIGLDFDFGIYWHWGSPRLDRFRAVAFAEVSAELFLEAMAETPTWEDSWELAEITLPTIPVWGPVNLVPEIDVDLMVRASAQASLRIDTTELGLYFEAGAEYVDGEVRAVFTADEQIPELSWPGMSAGAEASLEIGPRVELELLVNGMVGPQIWVDPLKLGLSAEAEVTVDPEDPEGGAAVVELLARLYGEWGINLAIEVDLGPVDWEWESESLHGELYDLARFIDVSIDVGRACEPGECGHVVLPVHGEDSSVNDVSDTGIAVGEARSGTPEDTDFAAVWWDATATSPAAQVLPSPMPGDYSAWLVSPNGEHALGRTHDVGYHALRWDLSGPAPVAEASPTSSYWTLCDIADDGSALLNSYDSDTNTHQLVRWTPAGAIEPIAFPGDFVRDVPLRCGARILPGGLVVATRGTGFGPVLYRAQPGGAPEALAAGALRDLADDGTAVGYRYNSSGLPVAVVWDTTVAGGDPTVLPGGSNSVAEGLDDAGNIYGVAQGFNALWTSDGSGYSRRELSSQMNIWDVSPDGWVFGFVQPIHDGGDPGIVDAPIMQWHDDWFVDFLGGGRLGDYFDTANEGGVGSWEHGRYAERRTVYFGVGDSWSIGHMGYCWPPEYPVTPVEGNWWPSCPT